MRNYSHQRETILQVLRSTDTHPTANWVYTNVRKVIPNISLGTVYRNLSLLTASGDILSINVGDGFEHFDGNTAPHAHLHCKCCGSITDASLVTDYLSVLGENYGFTVQNSVYVAYGICKKCNNKLKK